MVLPFFSVFFYAVCFLGIMLFISFFFFWRVENSFPGGRGTLLLVHSAACLSLEQCIYLPACFWHLPSTLYRILHAAFSFLCSPGSLLLHLLPTSWHACWALEAVQGLMNQALTSGVSQVNCRAVVSRPGLPRVGVPAVQCGTCPWWGE